MTTPGAGADANRGAMDSRPPGLRVRVRHGTPGDAAPLAAFGAQAFMDSFAADNTPENMAQYLAEHFGTSQQAHELADPLLWHAVAETDEGIVGSARLGFGPAPAAVHGRRPAEIARFYAAKHYIGKGVGRALMEYCLQAVAERGCDVLWLGVWEHNTRAIAFYERWGFATVGTTVFQLGTDAQTDFVMVRPLTSTS